MKDDTSRNPWWRAACRYSLGLLALTLVCGCAQGGGAPAPADGGGTDGGGTDGGGGGGGETPASLIKTAIEFVYGGIQDSGGKLAVGNDLIVWGLPDEGVFYLVPSSATEAASAGTQIPSSDLLYGYRNFAVAGKKVVLVRGNNGVAVFDTTVGGTPTDVPTGDITLHPLPVAANEPGHMMADGELVATINDTTSVTDGNAIKVIDVSGSAPVVLSCAFPTEFLGTFAQVAVDAVTRQVAAYGRNPGESIFVWDLNNPTTQPTEFDLFGDGVSTSVQIRMDGGYVLYRQAFTDATALLNISDGTVTAFTNDSEFAVTSPVALDGGRFGFFVAEESADSVFGGSTVHRSAIGSVGDAPGATLASQIDEITPAVDCGGELGRVGYGGQMAITPDGARWFLSGTGPIDNDLEYLQMNNGSGWQLFTDAGTLTGHVMATDVVCSSNTVAFRALRQQVTSGCLTDDDWVLGFIVLDRLP
jgi:hypothetical protein